MKVTQLELDNLKASVDSEKWFSNNIWLKAGTYGAKLTIFYGKHRSLTVDNNIHDYHNMDLKTFNNQLKSIYDNLKRDITLTK